MIEAGSALVVLVKRFRALPGGTTKVLVNDSTMTPIQIVETSREKIKEKASGSELTKAASPCTGKVGSRASRTPLHFSGEGDERPPRYGKHHGKKIHHYDDMICS